MLLFSDVMHRGSTGLMHLFKEDHEFKAGMSGNKVQSIDSRRKHSQTNELTSMESVLCGRSF